MVELHIHGGRAVVAAVQAAIGAHPGARLAEPGEFTRRALENGVIDLTEAEGLGDLLAAQTEGQRRAALRVADGGLRALVEKWADKLIEIAARIEAQLDFSDEDDVAEEAGDAILAEITALAAALQIVLAAPPVERLHEGVRIVIAGPPNSGKSTLLNALAGRDVAIVSPIAGTTRDRIEAAVVRRGMAYLLTDTAGLTDTPGDVIERIGIDRARDAIVGADIVIWLDDKVDRRLEDIHVHPRCDLPGRVTMPKHCDVAVSALSGEGIENLWTIIAGRAAQLVPAVDAVALNVRQHSLILEAHKYLSHGTDDDLLIAAENVRGARRSLDLVVGRVGLEEVLDTVFAKFCIGK